MGTTHFVLFDLFKYISNSNPKQEVFSSCYAGIYIYVCYRYKLMFEQGMKFNNVKYRVKLISSIFRSTKVT